MELTFDPRPIRRDSSDGRGARSAVAACVYQNRERGIDRDGHTYDYRCINNQSDYINRTGDWDRGKAGHEEVIKGGVILPEGRTLESYGWQSSQQLWTAVENAEDAILANRFRRDPKRVEKAILEASPAWRIIGSLQNDIPRDQAVELLHDFANQHIARHGVPVEFVLHDKWSSEGVHNFHFHMIFGSRPLNGDGTFSTSKAEFLADRNAMREWTLEGRALLASLQNERLVALGVDERVEHLSFAERGIERTASQHRGIMKTVAAEAGLEVEAQAIRQTPEQLAAEVIAALDGHNAVWSSEQFSRSVSRAAGGDAPAVELAVDHLQEMIESGQVVQLADGKFSTAIYIESERSALDCGARLTERQSVRLDLAALEARLASSPLSTEQRAAALHVSGDGDLKLLVGLAGAGKTTLLKEVVDQARSEGRRVVGISLAGVAVDGLTKSAGCDVGATVAAWRFAESRTAIGKLAEKSFRAGDLILIDEAGMIGTRDMRDLLSRAESVGAKVVLVGDPDQLTPIDAGSPFKALLEKHEHARVEEIRRQREGWQREASQAFAEGRLIDGLKAYAERGFVHIEDNPINRIVDDYCRDLSARPEGSRLALAGLRDEVASLNESIRSRLIETGHLSQVAGVFKGRQYYVGERVMFGANDGGSLVRSATPEAERMASADFQERALAAMRSRHSREWDEFKSSRRWASRNLPKILAPVVKRFYDKRYQKLKRYQNQEIEKRRALLTAAQRETWGQGVRNGEFGHVVGMRDDGSLRVRLDSGRTVDVSSAPNQWGQTYDGLSAGYAASSTVHRAQGATVDRAFVLSSQNTDRNAAYVAATRHREQLDVYADSKQFKDFQQIAESWDRRGGTENAADYKLAKELSPLAERIARLKEQRMQYAQQMAALARAAKIENCHSWELDPQRWRALSEQRRAIKLESRELSSRDWKELRQHARLAGVSQADLGKWSGNSRLSPEQIKARERVEAWAEKVVECRDEWNRVKQLSDYKNRPEFAAWNLQKQERDRMASRLIAEESLHRQFVGEVGLPISAARKMSQDHQKREARRLAGQDWQPSQAAQQAAQAIQGLSRGRTPGKITHARKRGRGQSLSW